MLTKFLEARVFSKLMRLNFYAIFENYVGRKISHLPMLSAILSKQLVYSLHTVSSLPHLDQKRIALCPMQNLETLVSMIAIFRARGKITKSVMNFQYKAGL